MAKTIQSKSEKATPEIQAKNRASQVERIIPYQWKKGQSGNILGRPKGKTMKDWAREYISKMTDEERDEWLEGIPKEIIWKMAEGNPKQDTDVTSNGEQIQPVLVKFINGSENNRDTRGI